MLGIRLDGDAEARLERYARDTGRPKSALARDWIIERLERESIDEKIRNATALDAAERERLIDIAANDATGAWLRWMDAEDGGYDWGPAGPPA